MDRTSTAASFALTLFFVSLLGYAQDGSAKVNTRSHLELGMQSFTDSLVLKKTSSTNVPLNSRSFGIFASYGKCVKGREAVCIFPSLGLGIASAIVESASADYVYKDNGALIYNGTLGLGLKHHFPKSLSTALLSLDAELRSATYRAPTLEYSIREENMTYNLWARLQFNFPLSTRTSFYHAFMFSPLDTEFAYRIGISLF